jgi:hypothetical protein
VHALDADTLALASTTSRSPALAAIPWPRSPRCPSDSDSMGTSRCALHRAIQITALGVVRSALPSAPRAPMHNTRRLANLRRVSAPSNTLATRCRSSDSSPASPPSRERSNNIPPPCIPRSLDSGPADTSRPCRLQRQSTRRCRRDRLGHPDSHGRPRITHGRSRDPQLQQPTRGGGGLSRRCR